MIYKQFYSELGKLLYAVADVDHVITQQEKQVLQNSVKNVLVPHEQHVDEYGTDAAYYAEIEFDILEEQIADSESSFESFIAFIEKHKTALDKNMVKACIHIAEKLADAYRGTNKKEKELIERLKLTVDNLKIKK